MLTNVMLTNLLLFYLLFRVARYLLVQPACADSFHACRGGKHANRPALAWSPQASLGQPMGQPFVEITAIAALREETASAKSAQPLSQMDVCQNTLVNREALDACFAELAQEDDEFNDLKGAMFALQAHV